MGPLFCYFNEMQELEVFKRQIPGISRCDRGLCGNSTDSHPIIFRWSNLKGGSLNLVELFDQVGHLSWHFSLEFSPGAACDSVLASFLNSPRHTFDLR